MECSVERTLALRADDYDIGSRDTSMRHECMSFFFSLAFCQCV